MSRLRLSRYVRAVSAAFAASVCALPAHSQTLGLAPSHDVSLWRVVSALLFCCALGAAGAFALKVRMRNRPMAQGKVSLDWRQLVGNLRLGARAAGEGTGRLKVVETVRLGYQVEVSLLECDGKAMVIVTSPHGAFVADPEAPVPDKTGSPS